MKTTADATISVDQLTAKFKMWQLYTQLLEYIRQGKNRIRLVASCRWTFTCATFRVEAHDGIVVSLMVLIFLKLFFFQSFSSRFFRNVFLVL